MRIFLILGEDNFLKPPFVKKIIDARKKDIVGIAIVPAKFPKSSFLRYLRKQFEFFGFFDFIYLGTLTFFYRFLDILTKNYSVKGIVSKSGLPIHHIKNVNDEQFLQLLKKSNIDVILSSCPQIFGKELLAIPKIACINRHSSLLPKYGGLMPVFWAMLNDEKQIGVTIHEMVEKIDEGKIITQKAIDISKNDSMHDLYKKCFDLSAELVLEAFDILEHKKPYKKIEKMPKSYFRFPKRKDIQEFRQKGKKLV